MLSIYTAWERACVCMAATVWSVLRLATTIRGSNLAGDEFPASVQTGPEAHPAPYTMRTAALFWR